MGRKLFGVVACASVLLVPTVARADEATTTTSAPTTTSSTTTSSTTASTTSTTTPRRATTTTTPPLQYDPAKEPVDDHDHESVEVEAAPPAVDGPVLGLDLSSATFDPRAADAYAQWNRARAALDALVGERAGRVASGERLRQAARDARRAVAEAEADARASSRALRHYAVSVYVNPSMEPERDSRAGELVAQLRAVLVGSYGRARARVAQREQAAALADQAARAAARFTGTDAADPAIATARANVDALAAALRLYAVGNTGTPSGFRFPVGGSYRFSNSWGAPRMTGTRYAHAHQGVDVFAAKGTPLLAVEPGVVVRRGTDRLGGRKLWLVGDSGYTYYYAHLDQFVPTVVDGTRVTPGQTIGYVGDSGNAQGGAAHLHFELHVRGVAVNPYPLLVVASSGDPNRRG